MKVSICIVTNKKNVDKQISDINKYRFYKDAEIIASCQNVSTPKNRNYCLDKTTGEYIIMLDDDITGFFKDWDKILVEPLLEDDSISIVSSRLVDKRGVPVKLMYDNFFYEKGYHQPNRNFVPSGAIAFRQSGIRFDEKYDGWGYDDTDFCKQTELAFPKRKVVIHNDCKLTHPEKPKDQDDLPVGEKRNRKHFHSKWGMVRKPKKPLMSIIYCSSNIEKKSFEKKITDGILRANHNCPIISVSQKPMDFGHNICVGDRGYSYLNAARQLKIGCEKATTPFVVMAESDCLYPESGYFDYEPSDVNQIYNYNSVWILVYRQKGKFYRKYQTNGSIIYGREWLIKFIDKCLEGLPIWSDKKIGFPWFSKDQKFIEFGSNPIINIITGVNGRKGTTFMDDEPRRELPYWGKARNISEAMFNE